LAGVLFPVQPPLRGIFIGDMTMHTQARLDARDAKRLIREQHYILKAVPAEALPPVLSYIAKRYGIQKKAMLKAKARYIRTRNH
jgi:hypothetical protein